VDLEELPAWKNAPRGPIPKSIPHGDVTRVYLHQGDHGEPKVSRIEISWRTYDAEEAISMSKGGERGRRTSVTPSTSTSTMA
jgi:hypothetical protein